MKVNETQGLIDLGHALLHAIDAMQVCKNMSADIAELEAWGQIFLDPAALPAEIRAGITKHAFAVTKNVAKARSEWAAEQFFDFGETMGSLLVIVLS